MRKVLSIAAVALFVAGSSAFACGGAGCSVKQSDSKKAGCAAADQAKCGAQKETKKCSENCTKPCCAKKKGADTAKTCPKK